MTKFTANDINTGLLEIARFGGGYTKESVDEQFELIREFVLELENKAKELETKANKYKTEAELFQTKKDELATAILDAQNVKEQKINEAKAEIGRELAEAKGRVKNANIEASKILAKADSDASEILEKANAEKDKIAKEASELLEKAQLDYDKKMGEAEAKANKLVEDAKTNGNEILHSAERESKQLIECAEAEAKNITSTASAKAATVIEETERIENVNKQLRSEMKDTVKSIIEPTINEFKDAILLLEQSQKDAVGLIDNKFKTEPDTSVVPTSNQSSTSQNELTPEQKEAIEASQKVVQETQEFLTQTVVKSSDDPLASAKALMDQLEKN